MDHAAQHLTAALDLHRAIGNRHGEAYDLRALATVHRDAGRLAQALELASAALALAREIGDGSLEAEALNALGSVRLQQGHPRSAVDKHQRALDLISQIGDRHPRVETLVDLAVAHRQNGEPTMSLACAEQALRLACRAHYRLLEGRAHTAVADAHLALGDYAKAGDHADHGVEIHRETGHRLGLAATLVIRGHVMRHTQGLDAARPCWQEALALFTDIGCPDADHVRTLLHPS